MRDERRYLGTCDVCGDTVAIVVLCRLHDRYHTGGVRDVCPECEADISRAMQRARAAVDGIVTTMVRRFVRVLRRRKR